SHIVGILVEKESIFFSKELFAWYYCLMRYCATFI
ncbi:MAG: hypothetical protein ACI9JY_002990, partial [Saprospiraceae bacterium]